MTGRGSAPGTERPGAWGAEIADMPDLSTCRAAAGRGSMLARLQAAAGSPDQSAFGMTVTREAQTVWTGDPGGPS